MNKFAFSAAVILFIGACALQLPTIPTPGPVVDTVATADASLKTAVIQTLTAQSTMTPVIVERTVTPVVALDASASPTVPAVTEATTTMTVVVDTATPEATGTFEIPTATEFSATQVPGPSTATLTPGVLTWGTLPPAVPFSYVTLINRAKTQAYISLQVVTAEGGPTFIEYPVRGQVEIKAPVGQYLYVAWVGGRKMVGEFRLHHNENLTITLYRDRVEIK